MPRSRPPIKNGIDLQLQSACSEGNWLVVFRLAEKRIRTSKDPYYETLKICAESQLDDPSTSFAAVAAAWQYVKDGTVIKDVDALDLLEWACEDHMPESDFSETLGTLRTRAVKAGLKNKHEAIRCLESCLLHWDLVNAQQIAAMMDRTYPQERMFMFWNIVITHMLSTNAQSPPEKKKLYGMLAQKQIERAAQASQNGDEGASEATKPTARTVQSEEEILLLYDVVEKHGTTDDLAKLINSSSLGPVPQFQKGRKELLMRTLRRYRLKQDWRATFDLCKSCLTRKDGDKVEPNFLAADWSIWQQFIEAAASLESVDTTAGTTVHNLLIDFAKSPSLRPIYRRNILLARLAAVFTLCKTEGSDAVDGKPASLRLKELTAYLKDQYLNSACFNDVKSFIEKLDGAGLQWLAANLYDDLHSPSVDALGASSIKLLSLKIRFFVTTCRLRDTTKSPDGVRQICEICKTDLDTRSCHRCLMRIISEAMRSYQDLKDSPGSSQTGTLSELAILAALCCVDMAELSPSRRGMNAKSVHALYQALTILEEQLRDAPKDSVILLLLVQLHLRVGSAQRARALWDGLGVKRTIVDCIAPVLYDRLSTISPALLNRSDRKGFELSECVRSHYDISLKHRMPRRLTDAFESESYSSILQIPQYIENLRTGCTRAMSLVEEARTARLLEGPGGRVLDDSRYTEVSDDLELCETIDFGSFPSWTMSEREPVYAQLQLGPSPTNVRSHVSLLSEAFHEVLSYKPPAIYKVASTADPTFVLEHMSQISNSLSVFIASSAGCVTPAESTYFNLLSLLSSLIALTGALDRTAAEQTLPSLVESALSTLQSLKAFVSSESGGANLQDAGLKLSNLHDLTMTRDSAQATRLACQWILSHNEREKERDRSGQSGLPKELVAQFKRLQSAADEVAKSGKAWVASLQSSVSTAEFRKNLQSTISESECLQSVDVSKVVDLLVQSWKETLKGWQDVRWE